MSKQEVKKVAKNDEDSVPIVDDMIEEVERGHLKTILRWLVCVVGIYSCFMLNSYLKEIM